MICRFGLDGGGGGGGEGERGGLLESLFRVEGDCAPIFGKSWAHHGRSESDEKSKGGEELGGFINNRFDSGNSGSAKETDFWLLLDVSLGGGVAMDSRNFLTFALSFDDSDSFLVDCLPLLM